MSEVRFSLPPKWPAPPVATGLRVQGDDFFERLYATELQQAKKVRSATDDLCGFPLHLPDGVVKWNAHGAHGRVMIHSDQTECLDCGERWDTNDPEPPAMCKVRDAERALAIMAAACADFPFSPEGEIARQYEVTSHQ